MRVTVELSQDDILAAIHAYLEEQGVPTDSKGKPFPVEVFFNNEKLTGTNQLMARSTFIAESFSDGPYR